MRGVKVFLERRPWQQDYELRIGYQAGRRVSAASGVSADGQIVWDDIDANAELPLFAILSEDVVGALAKAVGEITQASDATVEALKDTREVRDRLLTLVEKAQL